ncbi:cytochrome c oxidase subunit 3 [Luteolibacter sp. GHJ8]|uniref:Cytochrome c oxidase subunit 3 n=1 Tax=Luteolibacter rhizosphaerae TaxID=2989719 RepID=A0ABT3G466_9BACT|nr:cytochrome c oxidase subunit 3 [Luteolibacter rhizosphaerae]MCW1914629.1 cytochrome c oxidase subunit 3 [Luteolibacter rhizosphaerae]
MEIPYIVTPRKDTGLFNSKIAIWLFLASEVMLFGGFFSAYIFLRLGADYPWPERTLPVLPGLINTFVLIASSVTVVFAWASLKLRQWGKFQAYMGFTVICSMVFMVLKGIEYNVKFHHQALRTKDFSIVEGHLAYELKDGVHHEHGHEPKEEDFALNHHGKKFEENVINFETTQVSFNTVRFHKDWVEEMIHHAKERNSTIKLASQLDLKTAPDKTVTFAAGTDLDIALLESIKKAHLAARAHNADLRTEELRRLWKEAKKANPEKDDRELSPGITVDATKLALMPEAPSISFTVQPPVTFHYKPRDIQESPAAGTLRDGTALVGKLLESPMGFHYVDAIDFRHLVMKAEEKGIDPAVAIANSWLMKENSEFRAIWEKQQKALGQLADALKEKGRVPTEKDKYRINWQEMAYYMDTDLADVAIKPGAYVMPGVSLNNKEQFLGPDYHIRHFPHLNVPREQVLFASKFAPAWNTYYAIYFTMTGLHGLHVIGGALVLAYYLFCGKKMYLSNPEWLANRVEIGGLFWHFVDLVWIFLFPILYLM